ncbi:MAG: hypothetical protein AAF762_01340 [Pseudomonadota bacterium]
MDLTRTFDVYCERTDFSYWSEPLNAVTNVAFLIVAIFMWRRSGGAVPGRVLSAILFAIGIGSYLFHTHATVWAVLLDVTPIMMFSLTYIFLANRDYWGLPVWLSAVGSALYIPYSAGVGGLFGMVPFFEISSQYWPLPVLIFAYAFLLRTRLPETSQNLAIGASILCVSLAFRSLDEPLCDVFPAGTHTVWHILNAIMLGWMIETWLRHRRAVLAS